MVTNIKEFGSGTFQDIINDSAPEIQDIARTLQTLIDRIYPGVIEVNWINQKIAGYGVGPKKMSEHFCYVGIFKNHVNLGFYRGSELPDPNKLLTGVGKRLRHIKITAPQAIEDPAIASLLKEAVKNIKESLASR